MPGFFFPDKVLYTINVPKISQCTPNNPGSRATSPLASVKGTLMQISKFHYVFGFI